MSFIFSLDDRAIGASERITFQKPVMVPGTHSNYRYRSMGGGPAGKKPRDQPASHGSMKLSLGEWGFAENDTGLASRRGTPKHC